MSTEENNNQLTSIDQEINRAISTVNELESWVKQLSDEQGKIRIEKENPLKDKFSQLHKEVELLTQALVELGILDANDIK